LLLAAGTTTAESTSKKAEEGFVSLFNGKDLDGWRGATKGYAAEDGKLVCLHGGNLFTEKEYANFVFRFEFKNTPGGNNGVAIRSPLRGNPAFKGMEVQILDDDHPKWKKLKPYQFHGGIYGVVAPKRGHVKPAGQWNSQEIIADGSRIKVTLNGTVIVDADLSKIDPKKTVDGHHHPGIRNKKGHIGFMGHGARTEFRDLQIKELP
jgi:hypothetical protein